ncbi:MAG: hypothetical protein U0514_03825 [Candidatus Andersenbacteria bacterium]
MRVPAAGLQALLTLEAYAPTDCYWTTVHASSSAGETIITYEGQPVWCMRYQGAYEKAVTPFLKEVLARAYAAGKFFGGRGEHGVTGEIVRDGTKHRVEYRNYRELERSARQARYVRAVPGARGDPEDAWNHARGFHDYAGGWIPKR